MSDNVAKTVHIQAWIDSIQLADVAKFMESFPTPSNRVSDIVRFAFDLAYQQIRMPASNYFRTASEAIQFLKQRGLLREQSARSVRAIAKTLVEEDRRVGQLQGLIESFSRSSPTPSDMEILIDHPPETVKEDE